MLPNVFQSVLKSIYFQQEVNSDLNFEDVNVDLGLSLLKLIYGIWLLEGFKEINRVLPKNDSKYKIYEKSQKLSFAKYANLKIAKVTCRKIFML